MPVVLDEENGTVTHEETGGVFLLPDQYDGPEEWASALFEKNQEGGSINKEKFRGIGHGVFHLVVKENRMKGDLKRAITDMIPGEMADEDAVKEAAKTVIEKVGQEVVPFVADQIFDWLDRDKDKGVTETEIKIAIQLFKDAEEEDKGPETAFGMLFQAIDSDSNGKLSVDELSEFFASFVNLAGKCALTFINVVSETFRDDMVDQVVGIGFSQLDENSDGKLDKDELAMMVMGLEQMTEGLKQAREFADEPPQKLILDIIERSVKMCTEAGDLSPEGFHDLCCKCSEENIDHVRDFMNKGVEEGELPIPPPLLEIITPFVDIAQDTFKSATRNSLRPLSDAYFELLDADSDGTLTNAELMSLMNLFSTDEGITGEDKFHALFSIVDTDGDGSIDKAEGTAFGHKSYDLAVASAKFGVQLYQEMAKAVANKVFHFFIEKIAGGEELSQETFNELASGFAEHGPEVLMAPLMEGMEEC